MENARCRGIWDIRWSRVDWVWAYNHELRPLSTSSRESLTKHVLASKWDYTKNSWLVILRGWQAGENSLNERQILQWVRGRRMMLLWFLSWLSFSSSRTTQNLHHVNLVSTTLYSQAHNSKSNCKSTNLGRAHWTSESAFRVVQFGDHFTAFGKRFHWVRGLGSNRVYRRLLKFCWEASIRTTANKLHSIVGLSIMLPLYIRAFKLESHLQHLSLPPHLCPVFCSLIFWSLTGIAFVFAPLPLYGLPSTAWAWTVSKCCCL